MRCIVASGSEANPTLELEWVRSDVLCSLDVKGECMVGGSRVQGLGPVSLWGGVGCDQVRWSGGGVPHGYHGMVLYTTA